MANTYEAIRTVTVGSGGTADIEFTNIPATYTDILVKYSLRGSDAANYINNRISFNNSTSNYTSKLLYGDGSAADSENNSVTTAVDFSAYSTGTSATGSTFSSGEAYIPNYAGSNNKSVSVDHITENNATAAIAALTAGLWSDSAAITSLKITPGSGTFAQYSTATLYGIKNS